MPQDRTACDCGGVGYGQHLSWCAVIVTVTSWQNPEDMHEPDCEHGLSAWLCAGPMHYPAGS